MKEVYRLIKNGRKITLYGQEDVINYTFVAPTGITFEVDVDPLDSTKTTGWVKKSDASFTFTAPAAGSENDYIPDVYHFIFHHV